MQPSPSPSAAPEHWKASKFMLLRIVSSMEVSIVPGMKAPLPIPSLTDDSQRLRQAMTSSRVLEVLRQAIVQLQLRPGSQLSESEIGKQLGVSRQPVREAFIKLDEVGLVEIRPQRGTVVRLISRREVYNIRFLREAVEVAIIRKAAEIASDADITALNALLADQKRLAEDNNILFLQLDEAFHQALARSAECEDAWRVLDRLKLQMDRVRFLSVPNASPIRLLVAQHERMVDAVSRHDSDAAEKAMREHLGEILTTLPKLAEQYPEFFAD